MWKKCRPLLREAHFQVKMLKTPYVRTTFGRPDVEKVHAVEARSRFGRKMLKKTCSDHFLTFKCHVVWQIDRQIDPQKDRWMDGKIDRQKDR